VPGATDVNYDVASCTDPISVSRLLFGVRGCCWTVGCDGEVQECAALDAYCINFLDLKMSGLVSGYSSDENDQEIIASNPFGIAKSNSNPSKRMKLDGPSLKVDAAPDVLSEVT
jgi:hypothetical protein